MLVFPPNPHCFSLEFSPSHFRAGGVGAGEWLPRAGAGGGQQQRFLLGKGELSPWQHQGGWGGWVGGVTMRAIGLQLGVILCNIPPPHLPVGVWQPRGGQRRRGACRGGAVPS